MNGKKEKFKKEGKEIVWILPLHYLYNGKTAQANAITQWRSTAYTGLRVLPTYAVIPAPTLPAPVSIALIITILPHVLLVLMLVFVLMFECKKIVTCNCEHIMSAKVTAKKTSSMEIMVDVWQPEKLQFLLYLVYKNYI